jgi:hypothetical protein
MAEKKKGVATKTKPSLWKQIVAEVKAGSAGGNPGQWSARKAQIATARYKKRGGSYKGKKSSKNNLSRWTKQKWRTSDGSKSRQPGKATKRYLPDKAWKKMSKSEKAQTNRKKAADDRKGKQFSRQPKKVAKKAKRYRK